MRLGMSQYLIGCKAAAEISHLNSVYGIVTDYMQSNFLHSLDEKIGLDEHTCQSCSVYNESHMDTYGHQCNNQESIVIYKSELPTNNRTNGPTDQCQITCTSDSLLDMT
ncbi:hypothetical protein BATDEDRAFT_24840 [Batrachochytrium dendrobatidis JAM81]|uniref:Uncharacterized protein n=1 Tax=Batrachochytrium dendrobatidis (strain JAM81 / FGSC 10211) TaxID=684364 RepID=F4P368_BATDJ|nr:uncharacterized protein BATDEDRAFT_24840 [Batrachochytrium dendrobatidis JAM81]EGF80091.1 hypothetical protein BATDEDRAFT_24840 [Batrachochytrium dendrobatidis JAM81]|eukprot:XP_006678940.1 hypothetical protein BATDEDRAFT_24840 [Batrachochytrium dendrobatidis JAM81]